MIQRVGMILDADFPPDARVRNEALCLLDAGFEVYLFALAYKHPPGTENIEGINVVRLPASTLLYKLSALAYTWPFYHQMLVPRIRRFIEKYQIEALHIHDIQVARAVFNANKRKLPVVLDLHENRPVIMAHYRHTNTWLGKRLIKPQNWEKWQRRLVPKADFVAVVTEEAKQDIINNYGVDATRIIVLPNTVRKSEFLQASIRRDIKQKFSGSFNLLYLGDTGLRRGIDTAIESLAILKKEIPNIRLILVGKSSEDKVLRDLVIKLQVEKNVSFEGWQPPELLPSYIAVSDICLSPLKRNRHHDTTYANKIFQYMALGKPIVASNCLAQARLIVKYNTGLIFEAGEPKDMANKIKQLFQNQENRLSMGENGRKLIREKINWEKTGESLVKVYRQL